MTVLYRRLSVKPLNTIWSESDFFSQYRIDMISLHNGQNYRHIESSEIS